MNSKVAVHEGLFVDGEPPRLLGSRCNDCGEHHFPRHENCAYCSSTNVVAADLSTKGKLWTWTAVNSAPPGYLGEVPFGFGVVEIPEGIRVVSRLTEPDPNRLVAGQAMELVIVPLHVDGEGRTVITYAFSPVDSKVEPESDSKTMELQ